MRIEIDQIKAVYVNGMLLCAEHADLENLDHISDLDSIVTEETLESTDALLFCDQCGERIS